jgi:AcrR family transcriptional regulator
VARTTASPRTPAGARIPHTKPSPVDKFDRRRIELADATLQTLANLGYARTSLREIAQNSEFSHGVLHYYFADKRDLISCSIRHYKTRCATRYDDVVAKARTREELTEGFLDKLAETMREEPHVHSLWYDLRAQALFEPSLRDDVEAIDRLLEAMVWRIVSRYAELGGAQPHVASSQAYALLDGLFQKHLLWHVSGDMGAIDSMTREVRQLLPMLA